MSDTGAGFDLAAVAVAEPVGGISSKFGLFSIEERIAVDQRILGAEVEAGPGYDRDTKFAV